LSASSEPDGYFVRKQFVTKLSQIEEMLLAAESEGDINRIKNGI